MKNKKIFLVCQNFIPEPGGSASRNYDLARFLVKFGNEVEVICNHPTYPFGTYKRKWKIRENEEIENFDVCRIWTWQPKNSDPDDFERIIYYLAFSLHALINLIFKVRKNDIVVISQPPDSNILVGFILKKLRKCIWVIDIRDLWQEAAVSLGFIRENGFIDNITNYIKKRCYKKADKIGYVTQFIKDYLIQKYNIDDEKFIFNPNGIDPDIFYPRKIKKKKQLIFVGHIGYAQNIDLLINLIKEVNKKNLNCNFLVIGDGEKKKDIENAIRENRIRNVHLTGRIERDKIPDMVSESLGGLTFVPNQNISESFVPIKMLEYMGCGIPVLGIVPETMSMLINENEYGFVSNKMDELIDYIQILIENQEFSKRMGKNGMDFVLKNYNKKHTIKNFIENILTL